MTNLISLPARISGNGNQIVAANIRSELGYLGLSQGKLAEVLQLSEMAVTRRLSDKYASEFSASEILDVANFFGISVGELFKTRVRNKEVPASSETGTSDSVAGTGFEPATSGL